MEKFIKSKAIFIAIFIFIIAIIFVYSQNLGVEKYDRYSEDKIKSVVNVIKPVPKLDTELYDKKMLQLANNPPVIVATSSATTTQSENYLWPVKTVYPNYGALLPFNRIVAYYGNFYSTKMGVLGEYSTGVMLDKLSNEVKKWELADPSTPVIPAIHYIAATAQASPGADGKYMFQMPFSEIDKAIELAKKIKGVTFLDLQIGNSDVITEVKAIQKYLEMPDVHLGIDPEFAMKPGVKPGTRIGTIDAKEINQVITLLATIVRDNNLPPKVLIIHRFTEEMVTNYKDILPVPEVQVVMDMDGWGGKQLKKNTYRTIIYNEPVQFSGFKLFYKNDIRNPGTEMLTPEEVMKLRPIPIYIQYQ